MIEWQPVGLLNYRLGMSPAVHKSLVNLRVYSLRLSARVGFCMPVSSPAWW